MAKLTKKEFESKQAAAGVAEHVAALKRKQTALVKKAFDWQEKEGIHAWGADDLEEDTGIHLAEGLFLLEKDGLQAQFYREPDMQENEGRLGAYTLRRLDGEFWRLEKAASRDTQKPAPNPEASEDTE